MIGRIVFWLVVVWIVVWAIHHQPEVTGWINSFLGSAQR
jgi:hypothetical protein